VVGQLAKFCARYLEILHGSHEKERKKKGGIKDQDLGDKFSKWT